MNASNIHKQSAGPAPARAPNSIRRTSSIDVSWPEGWAGPLRLVGKARDILTSASGAASGVMEDGYEALLNKDRSITALVTDPKGRADLTPLIGLRAGGHLRRLLKTLMAGEQNFGSPLHLILDDMPGASLVSPWAWSQWKTNWREQTRTNFTDVQLASRQKRKEGVCVGFAPGSSAFDLSAIETAYDGAPAPDLRNPLDPEGWHEFPPRTGASFRRARRIDIAISDVIAIESAFQDSAVTRDEERRGVHEYTLSMTVDAATLRVLSLSAQPRILPYPECPSAMSNLPKLIGAPVSELREIVPELLAGTAGCTHLNDAMRALSDAPFLIERLRTASFA